jgi:hypothetical protein
LIGGANRLWRRHDELSLEQYTSRRTRIDRRLVEMIDMPWEGAHAKRLITLGRLQHHLFNFLSQEGVLFDDHHAERSIRLAVIIRKNSYGNRSQHSADCQALLMSVFSTLKQRGHEPIRTIIDAIATYLLTPAHQFNCATASISLPLSRNRLRQWSLAGQGSIKTGQLPPLPVNIPSDN